MKLTILFKNLRKAKGYYADGLIEVDKKLGQSEMVETLYHEFTHYIIDLISQGKLMGKITKDTRAIAIKEPTINQEEELCAKIETYCTKEIDKFLRKNS